jgi:hypothetical protein
MIFSLSKKSQLILILVLLVGAFLPGMGYRQPSSDDGAHLHERTILASVSIEHAHEQGECCDAGESNTTSYLISRAQTSSRSSNSNKSFAYHAITTAEISSLKVLPDNLRRYALQTTKNRAKSNIPILLQSESFLC